MALFTPHESLPQCVERGFRQHFGGAEPSLLDATLALVQLAMANLERTDAPYHNTEHTTLVTMAGLDILRGKAMLGDTISAREWASYVASLLFHDIGYLRKLFPEDTADSVVLNTAGERFALPAAASDAALTAIHVDRSIAFVERNAAHFRGLDREAIVENIENTRFPPPPVVFQSPRSRHSWPDLARAADLIGQFGDPHYLQKLPALFAEFEECGTAQAMGLTSHQDLAARFPRFIAELVHPLIDAGFVALDAAPEGQRWRESLNRSVARCE